MKGWGQTVLRMGPRHRVSVSMGGSLSAMWARSWRVTVIELGIGTRQKPFHCGLLL